MRSEIPNQYVTGSWYIMRYWLSKPTGWQGGDLRLQVGMRGKPLEDGIWWYRLLSLRSVCCSLLPVTHWNGQESALSSSAATVAYPTARCEQSPAGLPEEFVFQVREGWLRAPQFLVMALNLCLYLYWTLLFVVEWPLSGIQASWTATIITHRKCSVN